MVREKSPVRIVIVLGGMGPRTGDATFDVEPGSGFWKMGGFRGGGGASSGVTGLWTGCEVWMCVEICKAPRHLQILYSIPIIFQQCDWQWWELGLWVVVHLFFILIAIKLVHLSLKTARTS